METFVAGLAADHPGVSDPAERLGVLLGGCTHVGWIVSDPQGGGLAACEFDVDQVLCRV
jgi:hypothetical protein